MRFFHNLRLVYKINLIVFAVALITASALSVNVIHSITTNFENEAIASQSRDITLAASILDRDLETFSATNIDTPEKMRFYVDDIPTFENHDIIDNIGMILGETATVFIWDDETQDFWRKTTNIIKDDNTRAVGTPLGQKGAVYPYLTKGKNYTGEAVILGKNYYTRYDPIFLKGTDKVVGILSVGLEKSKFAKKVNEFLWNISLTGLIAILFILPIATLIIQWLISKPVSKIITQMNALARGDKQGEIDVLERNDEIGEISKALSIFRQKAIEVDALTEQQQETEKRNQIEKQKLMQELANEFDQEVGALIVALSETSGQLNHTAENMRQVSEKTQESSVNVVNSSEEASKNVNTVASAMEEMSASASEITSQMTNVKGKSDDTALSAKDANESVHNLNELATNIGEVVESIKGIAEQTNLLALNATIEAARAGDAGKGFSVVADEVKKLATETALKTEEIGTRIEKIQNATNKSVQSMEKIIHSISDIDSSIATVSSAVEEQHATTNEIVRSVADASQGVNQVTHIIETVQNDAHMAGQTANNVLESAQKMSEVSNNLKKAVDNFLEKIRT